MTRKLTIATVALLGLLGSAGAIQAQVAGGVVLGVTTEANVALASGWSAKKQIMGQDVYNDSKDVVGSVEDLIVTPDGTVSAAIIGVGGFLGMGEHYVAIPVKQFQVMDKKIVLPGATKDALKQLPQFQYNK